MARTRSAKPEWLENKQCWRVRYTDENGKRKSGGCFPKEQYALACEKLKKLNIEVEEIKLGYRLPRLPNKTFDELCEYWLMHRTSKKRSPKDDNSIISCHLRPFFGSMLIREIGIEYTDKFKQEKAHLNPKTQSNILTLLISMLKLANDINWIRKVPPIQKPSITSGANDFSYLRSIDEKRRFLLAALDEGQLAYVLYATALETGMRQGEIAGLRWNDIDFERKLITVQRSFNGPTKSNKVRHIPILATLLPVLQEWKLKQSGPLVFPNRDGNMNQRSARIFKQIFHRILDRADFPKTRKPNGHWKRYIVFHDLRHTFASHWMMNGGNLNKLRIILGHSKTTTTLIYAHFSPEAFAEDFNRMGATPLIREAKVIPLQKGF